MTERVVHQLDIVGTLLRGRGSTSDVRPLAVSGVGKIDRPDGRTTLDNVHLIYEYPDGVIATFEAITTNEYNPFGVECFEMIQGDKATMVVAHLSHYPALLFLEPDTPEAPWMSLAYRTKFPNENVTAKSYREPIILHPTEGRLLQYHWQQLYDWRAAKQVFPSYELELLDFKRSILDRTRPVSNGLVGLAAAVAVHAGLEAMEKRRRVEITEKMYELESIEASGKTAHMSTRAHPPRRNPGEGGEHKEPYNRKV
jgi:predicted dehydrogenase